VTAALRTHLGEDVELAWTTPTGRAPAASLGATIRLAQRIAEQDEKRIVLFLDEFQDIAVSSHRFGDPDVLTKQLRSELQRSPLVSVLFAGSMEHLMRDLFGPTRRALSQFGNFHELTPISPHEWEAGIAARYNELDVQAAKDTIAEVVVDELLVDRRFVGLIRLMARPPGWSLRGRPMSASSGPWLRRHAGSLCRCAGRPRRRRFRCARRTRCAFASRRRSAGHTCGRLSRRAPAFGNARLSPKPFSWTYVRDLCMMRRSNRPTARVGHVRKGGAGWMPEPPRRTYGMGVLP
jgi:hypothetical protein